MVFKTSDILYQAFATIEARCRGLLRLDNIEKLDELWCPIARSNEFGQTLRAKINVKGDNACLFGIPTTNARGLQMTLGK